jgi:hypothetical protein
MNFQTTSRNIIWTFGNFPVNFKFEKPWEKHPWILRNYRRVDHV